MGRNLLNFISQPLGLSPATPQDQLKSCSWLAHSRDFSCLWWDGGNQTEPRQVGIVARGAILVEAPGRGVILAGTCCNVGN